MANEKRLIDANALTKAHCEGCAKEIQEMCKTDPVCASMMWVVEAPTVDAVEVKHGRWIERPLDKFRKYEVKCSECGFVGIGNYDQYLEPYDFNYCPNCGAKMDGDGNEK